jgi:hypothetical protein
MTNKIVFNQKYLEVPHVFYLITILIICFLNKKDYFCKLN